MPQRVKEIQQKAINIVCKLRVKTFQKNLQSTVIIKNFSSFDFSKKNIFFKNFY